jgi:hypothetical protein
MKDWGWESSCTNAEFSSMIKEGSLVEQGLLLEAGSENGVIRQHTPGGLCKGYRIGLVVVIDEVSGMISYG